MSVRGLFQAVRSQLHFSQLSAWWSNSKGSRPTNVCYRVTLPEEAFASRFSRPPQHHTFPPAAVGPNTQLKVSVRTLPRCESLPIVKCAACIPETNVRKRSIGLEQPLLGESLLDPPGPSSSRAHAADYLWNIAAGLCKWHTSSPPSPPRRRPSRQAMARRCDKHTVPSLHILPLQGLVDDRMQTNCNQHGKHDCRCEEEVEEIPNQRQKQSEAETNKINLDLSKKEMEEVLTVLRVRAGDTHNVQSISTQTDKGTGKGDLFLSAILRSSQTPSNAKLEYNKNNSSCTNLTTTITNLNSKTSCDSSNIYSKNVSSCTDLLPSDLLCKERQKNIVSYHFHELKCTDKHSEITKDSVCLCKTTSPALTSQISNNPYLPEEKSNTPIELSDSLLCSVVDRFRTKQCLKKDDKNKCQEELSEWVEEFHNLDLNKRVETSAGRGVPTALDKAKFRRSLDSAASMVFHWRTGLPLTSSPAPLRRASQRFDFDSTLNSVSAIRSALFDSESGDDTESEGSSKSPCSPQIDIPMKGEPWTVHYQSPNSALLGSFEESVLNGRLEPVSTVHGFTADLGASGSFCPSHLVLPVTVFFYTLGDNDKVSTPYLAHINLGKKGYVVPRCGTIQVTLLNPLGTVIKMFVVMYNLTDMPNNSHTFLRQRTLYMPTAMSEPLDNSQKYLRYLIHLRFASSKSGRLFLHTDIRMIIFRKSDMDTATGHGVDMAYELRSFTYGPSNPKFSPRK